jgi:hypothetical protein
MWRCKILVSILVEIFKAWRYVVNERFSKVKISSIQSTCSLNDSKRINDLVNFVENIVKKIASRSNHICFYRSYVLAQILRKRGLPVVMNIGLGNFGADSPVRGHCWLTLDGENFFESSETETLYPVYLGKRPGDIAFWVKPGQDKGMIRQKIAC